MTTAPTFQDELRRLCGDDVLEETPLGSLLDLYFPRDPAPAPPAEPAPDPGVTQGVERPGKPRRYVSPWYRRKHVTNDTRDADARHLAEEGAVEYTGR